VFYDASQRTAPTSKAAYLAAEHVTVLYEPRRTLDVDDWLAARGVPRQMVASVPGMAGLAALLRGGPWLATAPSLMAQAGLQGLARAPVPVATPRMPLYMAWHLRHQADPVHRWLRAALEAVTAEVRPPARVPAAD